ncbi:hypothetical protein [Kamptonema formosum]|uniref:hypothetical protein n=1 Tax=Kamptonema formosum TaxID=331992 RepID=UPI0012DCC9A9|nr:hypothetical protein [Oscillatoria sp. PCC 10802]
MASLFIQKSRFVWHRHFQVPVGRCSHSTPTLVTPGGEPVEGASHLCGVRPAPHPPHAVRGRGSKGGGFAQWKKFALAVLLCSAVARAPPVQPASGRLEKR